MIAEKAKNLQVLDVSDILGDKGLLALQNLPKLNIIVAISSKLTTDGVLEFLTKSKFKGMLAIAECKSIKEKKVKKFVKNNNLELEVNFYSDAAIELDETVWDYKYPDVD